MKIRVIDSNGIKKIEISKLARLARARREDMKPPIWTPDAAKDVDFFIPPPPGHDPKGRNRR